MRRDRCAATAVPALCRHLKYGASIITKLVFNLLLALIILAVAVVALDNV
jgi:hypothetical protein